MAHGRAPGHEGLRGHRARVLRPLAWEIGSPTAAQVVIFARAPGFGAVWESRVLRGGCRGQGDATRHLQGDGGADGGGPGRPWQVELRTVP